MAQFFLSISFLQFKDYTKRKIIMNCNSNTTWWYAENSLVSENEQLEPFFGQSHHPPPPQEVNNLPKSQSTLDLENVLAELSPHDNQISAAPTTNVHVENPNFDKKVLRKQLELACAAPPMRLSTVCTSFFFINFSMLRT